MYPPRFLPQICEVSRRSKRKPSKWTMLPQKRRRTRQFRPRHDGFWPSRRLKSTSFGYTTRPHFLIGKGPSSFSPSFLHLFSIFSPSFLHINWSLLQLFQTLTVVLVASGGVSPLRAEVCGGSRRKLPRLSPFVETVLSDFPWWLSMTKKIHTDM